MLCRLAVAEDLLLLLPGPARSSGGGGGGRKGHAPSLASLQRLHALLSAHDSPVLRHLAFAALMRCGGLAPTLFREEEDVGPAAAAGAALKQIPDLCAPPRTWLVRGSPGMNGRYAWQSQLSSILRTTKGFPVSSFLHWLCNSCFLGLL